MSEDLRTHRGVVAFDGERLVGFATWNPIDAEVANLSWMGVAEDRHREGVGRALLAAVVESVRAQGFLTLEVSTVADSVDYEPYARTRRFYRAMGFVDYRVDALYFGEDDSRYDRLLLRLDLAASA